MTRSCRSARWVKLPAGLAVPALLALLAVSCAGVPRGHTTALHAAADDGDVGSVKELISENGDIDARDEQGRTALHHAASAGDIIVAAALLDAGADPDLPDVDGRTSLHYAVLNCQADLVAMLLGADADALLKDDDESTPLDLAVGTECEDARLVIQSSMKGFVPESAD